MEFAVEIMYRTKKMVHVQVEILCCLRDIEIAAWSFKFDSMVFLMSFVRNGFGLIDSTVSGTFGILIAPKMNF